MMNLSGQPDVTEDKMLAPLMNYGVKCMSMGFFVPDDSPAMWRGPMVQSALDQMLRKVAWGVLDYLVIDMPPGTGDVHLTLSQRVPITGAVVVSTPQDIALIDARKGAIMFKQVNIPILGIVQNMSHYICSNCGHEAHIFGNDGVKSTALDMDMHFLGDIPLHESIRAKSDAGKPIVFSAPDSPEAQHYLNIAGIAIDRLEEVKNEADGPTIVME